MRWPLSPADALELRRSVLRDHFPTFVRTFWSAAEPAFPLRPSVAIDGTCAALQAQADGRLRRVVIAEPPGCAKSLIGAVLYPAWLLFRSNGRARVMAACYSDHFARRDSIRCRTVVESPTYRALADWELRDDADRQDDWWTTNGGRRLTASIKGRALGERCTHQVIDEAINHHDMYSEGQRAAAHSWIHDVLASRCTDTYNDPRALIGQRLHADDPASGCIARGWPVLALPALLGSEDEPHELALNAPPRALVDDRGRAIWMDPRKPTEPLHDKLDVRALAELRRDMTSGAYAAMYLENPDDESGGMFKRDWFKRRWSALPDKIVRKVITLDASFKDASSSDWAVIQVWASVGPDRMLLEQWRRKAGFSDTLKAMREIRSRHPTGKVLIEAAANGHAVLDVLKREIPGVLDVKPEGGKEARAASIQHIAESGNVVLPANAGWVEDLLSELCSFPGGKHDDQVDAMVHALRDMLKPTGVRGAQW